MSIDEASLMMVLGLASITASAMFFTLHAAARHIAGVRLWGLGSLSVGFAVLLDAPRLIETWQWASLLFNIPLGLGQAMFLVGTAQFVGKPYPRFALPLLAGVVVILTVLFTLAVPHSVARIFTLSSFQAVVNGVTAWLLWTFAEPQSKRAFRVASVVTIMQASAAFAQAFMVATSSVAITYAAPQLPFANLISWGGMMSNILLGNWILFLLIMLRFVGELKLMAGNDSLTGLLNRRGLRSHIDVVLAPERSIGNLAVLLLDIDHFKMINDKCGHDTGDKVLAMMGGVMRGSSGPNTVPCRWGGEEFCYVVDNFTDESLIELAEKVRQEFARVTAGHPNLPTGATVSIGVATIKIDSGFEFSKLVNLADNQLYLAKNGGRNRVCSTTTPQKISQKASSNAELSSNAFGGLAT